MFLDLWLDSTKWDRKGTCTNIVNNLRWQLVVCQSKESLLDKNKLRDYITLHCGKTKTLSKSLKMAKNECSTQYSLAQNISILEEYNAAVVQSQ